MPVYLQNEISGFWSRKGLLSSIRETQIIGTVNSQSTILTEEGNGRAEIAKRTHQAQGSEGQSHNYAS